MTMASPLIIPIFLPNLGCRQRCIFCNQKTVATEVPSPPRVRELLEASLRQLPSGQARSRQVAFYGGSFTAISKEDQTAYLREVQPFLVSGRIDSVRVSTRPDALDAEVLSLLRVHGVKTVEIGAQSMDNDVLLLSHRGHSAEETLSAVNQLKGGGFEVGIHLMIGLPGDSLDRFLQTLDQVIRFKPNFLRIHPTLVLKGAPLEVLWREGKYFPMTIDRSIQWLKMGLLKLEASSISIARIALQPTKELEASYLAGPWHPALRHLVDSEIFFDMATRLLDTHRGGPEPAFFCHPKEVSNVRGLKNGNIQRLKKDFGVKSLWVKGRDDLPRGFLVMQTPTGEITIRRGDSTD
jgi:histone acetyltransferase (RNA polymerase elongator complex component)